MFTWVQVLQAYTATSLNIMFRQSRIWGKTVFNQDGSWECLIAFNSTMSSFKKRMVSGTASPTCGSCVAPSLVLNFHTICELTLMVFISWTGIMLQHNGAPWRNFIFSFSCKKYNIIFFVKFSLSTFSDSWRCTQFKNDTSNVRCNSSHVYYKNSTMKS